MILDDNFRQEFYNNLKKGDKSVVLLVSIDTDALCTTMILTHLLRCDDIPFSLRVVDGWESVENVFTTLQDQKCNYIMINCGANRALSRLQLPPDSVAFVIDSHRPFNIENVFANDQVVMLMNQDERTDLPDVDKVLRDDSEDESSSDEDESDDGDRVSYEQRMEKIQRKAIRREERHLWERQRRNILFEYYFSTWYSTPSCVVLLELAADMNRISAETMWYAAVGLNSALNDKLISLSYYKELCVDRMRPFVPRFMPKNIINQGKVDDLFHIIFARELPLAIYAHWDLFSAMMVNEHFAIKTMNWTQKGDHNIRHLLTDLGITLHETKQKFESLPTEQRNNVVATLEKHMGLEFATFFGTLGYCGKLSACDVARAVTARLETPTSETIANRLSAGQTVLQSSVTGTRAVRQNLTNTFSCVCQRTLQVIWKTVAAAINQSEIISNPPFYLYSSSRAIDEDMVESRHFLYNTAQFMLSAFASVKKNRKKMPLIAMFPLSGEKTGWLVVTGVMPKDTDYEDSLLKTCIGRVFDRVKKSAPNLRIVDDYFHSDIIRLKSEDRARFLHFLVAVLEGTVKL